MIWNSTFLFYPVLGCFLISLILSVYYYRRSFLLYQNLSGEDEKRPCFLKTNLSLYSIIQLITSGPAIIYTTLYLAADIFSYELDFIPIVLGGLAGFGNVVVYFVQQRALSKKDRIIGESYQRTGQEDAESDDFEELNKQMVNAIYSE